MLPPPVPIDCTSVMSVRTGWPLEPPLRRIRGHPTRHETDVGAGTAHVQRDQVRDARRSAQAHCSRHAANGPRPQQPHREARRYVRRRDAAVGLHHLHRRPYPKRGDTVGHAAQRRPGLRHEVAVEHRRGEPLILPILRRHFRRERHRKAGETLLDRVADRPFVGLVGVGVKKAD